MKRVALVFMLALPIQSAFCLDLSRSEDAGKPVEIIMEIPGHTKDQLFSSTKVWIAETFVSAKTVIDEADKESGRIVAKGSIGRPCGGWLDCMANGKNSIGFTMRVDLKDGKVRTTYNNLVIIRPATNGSVVGSTYTPGTADSEIPAVLQDDRDAAKNGVTGLSKSLETYLMKETSASKDW